MTETQRSRTPGDHLTQFVDQHSLGIAGAFIKGQNQRGAFIHGLVTRYTGAHQRKRA
ncbi:hypothetical protein ALP19_200206 [Pseudomonas syringae pv. tomato]|nr:hypothetical protein ALP19_200206 [Pseudomonas syringae pv. tomato]